jgi:hypothetical protein
MCATFPVHLIIFHYAVLSVPMLPTSIQMILFKVFVPVRGPFLIFLLSNPKRKDHRSSAVRRIFATCPEVAGYTSEAVSY